MDDKERLLTRGEAAEYLGVQKQTLAMWACNKRYDIPFLKLGTQSVRYRKEDLDNFVNRCNVGTTEAK